MGGGAAMSMGATPFAGQAPPFQPQGPGAFPTAAGTGFGGFPASGSGPAQGGFGAAPQPSATSVPSRMQNDSCPDWFAGRSNQVSVEDLVARGIIAPERNPPPS